MRNRVVLCRFSDEEFEALQSVVEPFNVGDYAERQNLREMLDMRYSYGAVTISDIIRYSIKHQVGVIQAKISVRNTKDHQLSSKRNTRAGDRGRNTKSSGSAKKRNTASRR